MKSIITFFAIVVFVANTFAQAPSAFSYQAVIRNSTGNLIQNQTVGVRLSILQGSGTGTVIYSESQTPSTNINGLISLELGSGSVLSGSFSNINWSSGSYFVKTETDPSGGTSYSISGTSQLLSVPYALYSNKAGETIKEDVIIVIDTSNYLTIANVDDDRIVNIQGELLLTTNFQKLRNDRVTVMGGEVTGDLTYPEVQIGENIIENVKFSYVELDDDSETTYINCEFDYVKFGSGRFVNCIIDNCTSTSVREITSFSDCELNNCTFIRVDEIVNCEVDNSTIGNASYGTNYCKGNQIDDCSIYLDNIFASNDCDDSRVICLAGRDISIDGNTFDDPLSTSVDEIILINISSTRGNFNISNNFFEGQSSLEQFIKISVASSGTYKSMIMMSGNSFYYAERAITHNSSSVFISCNNNMYSRLSLGFGIVNGTNRNVRDNDSY